MRVLLLSLVVAGCSKQSAQPTPDQGPLPVQAALDISDDPEDFSKGNSYPLLTTMALYVRVTQPTLPLTTMLALKFTDPHGEMFYEDHSPFTTSSDPVMVQDGLMHVPMQAWPAKQVPGGWQIIRSVPVRGTNFTRIPQPDGAWGLTAELDGVPGQLSTTVMFTH